MVKPAEFLRHSLTMATGTAFAQVISFVAAPVLTRLYSPADFGAFATIVAASTVLSLAATMRFEFAIVVPPEEAAAANLFGIATALSLSVCGIVALVFAFLPNAALTSLFGPAAPFSMAIPALALTVAWVQIYNFAANRERRYGAMAASGVIQQASIAGISVVSALWAGATGLFWNGLMIGRLLGQIVGATFNAAMIASQIRSWLVLIDPREWAALAKKYHRFPLFSAPYSAIGTFSREFIVFALTAFHEVAAAGLYGLARTVIAAPIGVLSSALGQVYYKEAAAHAGTPEFARLTLSMMRSLALIATPFFVLGWAWAPDVFALVFGEQWRGAGTYASILMPAALLSIFTSWPERIFEARQRQHISLGIEIVFDIVLILSVFLLLKLHQSPTSTVRVFVGVQIAYHACYLFAVFRLSGLGIGDYLRFSAMLGAVVMVAAAGQILAMAASSGWVVGFLTGCILTAAQVLGQFFLARKLWRTGKAI